jgi:hypothetical protein
MASPQAARRASRICATCEYFDGGGRQFVEAAAKGQARLHGDCLNRHTLRLQTWSDDTCHEWQLDSERGIPW